MSCLICNSENVISTVKRTFAVCVNCGANYKITDRKIFEIILDCVNSQTKEMMSTNDIIAFIEFLNKVQSFQN